METILITTLALVAIAALIAAPTTYLRMRRRLELANQTHAQILTSLEVDHDERIARLKRDAEQSRRFAHHQLALEVLPVIDALDEACKYTAPIILSEAPENTQQPALQHGVTLAKKQLLQALERHGIEYIAPQPGDPFEPMCHEAVHLVEDKSLQAGDIARCLRAGFRQEDRVLRSAMVEVVAGITAKPATVTPTENNEDAPGNEDSAADNLPQND